MPRYSRGMHHLHRRKKKIELDKKKEVVDRLIYLAAVVGPVMTIPQIIKIWIEKNAAGVSLLAWVTYLFIALLWVAYGVVHREKPIIVTNMIWVFLEIFIVVGIVLYG